MKSFAKFVSLTLILSVAALFLPIATVMASPSRLHYQYLIGVSPVMGPVVTKAANGDVLEVMGSGDFSIGPTSVSGNGTLTHKDASGTVLATGTWQATRFMSFDSYGTSPSFPPNFEGGLALIKIHLTPSSGDDGFDGLMWINCLIGPGAHGAEGIRVYVPRVGLDFNQSLSGETLFIKQP